MLKRFSCFHCIIHEIWQLLCVSGGIFRRVWMWQRFPWIIKSSIDHRCNSSSFHRIAYNAPRKEFSHFINVRSIIIRFEFEKECQVEFKVNSCCCLLVSQSSNRKLRKFHMKRMTSIERDVEKYFITLQAQQLNFPSMKATRNFNWTFSQPLRLQLCCLQWNHRRKVRVESLESCLCCFRSLQEQRNHT